MGQAYDLAFPPRDRSLAVRVVGAADLLALDVALLPFAPVSRPPAGSGH